MQMMSPNDYVFNVCHIIIVYNDITYIENIVVWRHHLHLETKNVYWKHTLETYELDWKHNLDIGIITFVWKHTYIGNI